MSVTDPNDRSETEESGSADASHEDNPESGSVKRRPQEIGGRDGPDPTRYGDWEKNGRCIDF